MPLKFCSAKKYSAFTLAELLVSVLIISIIMVVLAPVITRRMKDTLTVQTDNIKGLEIYTNPGTYSFDVPIGINTLFIQGSGGAGGGAGATYTEKETSFTSTTNWTVPKGVYQITITITGSGGGGGGGNGVSTGKTKCTPIRVQEFLATRGGSNEEDLCWFKENGDVSWPPVNWNAVNANNGVNICDNNSSCGWNYTNPYCTSPSGQYSGCNRQVTTYPAAGAICREYGKTTLLSDSKGYRLPNKSELEKLKKYLNDWSRNAGANGLMLCSANTNGSGDEGPNVPYCGEVWWCKPAFDNYCGAPVIWGQDLYQFAWLGTSNNYVATAAILSASASTRCVKPLKYYTGYSGAGGASGAIMEQTINVLPKDVLEITIGSGGNGGSAKNNGSQGATTKIVHKRWRKCKE